MIIIILIIIISNYKVLTIIEMKNKLDEFIEYQRTKTSILDITANILSLPLSLFNRTVLGDLLFYIQTTKSKYKDNKDKQFNSVKHEKHLPFVYSKYPSLHSLQFNSELAS